MTPFHPFFHMFFKPPSFKSMPFVHYLHKSFYPYLLLFISGMDGKVFSRSNKILVGFLTKIMSSVSLCFFLYVASSFSFWLPFSSGSLFLSDALPMLFWCPGFSLFLRHDLLSGQYSFTLLPWMTLFNLLWYSLIFSPPFWIVHSMYDMGSFQWVHRRKHHYRCSSFLTKFWVSLCLSFSACSLLCHSVS